MPACCVLRVPASWAGVKREGANDAADAAGECAGAAQGSQGNRSRHTTSASDAVGGCIDCGGVAQAGGRQTYEMFKLARCVPKQASPGQPRAALLKLCGIRGLQQHTKHLTSAHGPAAR